MLLGILLLLLEEDEFDRLSEFLEKEFPELDWKTESLKPIEV